VAQEGRCLPSKCEALSSNTSAQKKKNKIVKELILKVTWEDNYKSKTIFQNVEETDTLA
jgi:hypothetical protein